MTLTAADRTGGSSLLQYFADGGSAFSLHDLAVPMVVLSDNTATNMLIDAVGLDRVNATMARLSRCDVPLTPASCAEVVRLLELPKGGTFRAPIPAAVAVAWKPGSLDGVSTAWGIVKLAGAPYAMAVMVTYGDGSAADVVGRISAAAYAHFAQRAGATDLGARVPPGVIRKPGR